jgi:hypothetical protein
VDARVLEVLTCTQEVAAAGQQAEGQDELQSGGKVM